MAEAAAISFLLENLKQLLVHKLDLIKGVKNEIDLLRKELELLRAFVVDFTSKRNKDYEAMNVLIGQIRELIFEAEDIIDAYVIQVSEKKTQNYFLRMTSSSKTLGIADQVQGIMAKIKNIFDKNRVYLATLRTGGGTDAVKEDPEEKKEPILKKDNIVGFEDETETVIGYLMDKTETLDVISIIGMPGLGKTTLSSKIFRDPKIEFKFPTRIWVNVSQDYKKKDVYVSILRHFTSISGNIYSKDVQDIEKLVFDHLKEGKFLIVMDDVWTAEAWRDLRGAFPASNSLGKILITSRNVEVANQANPNREPHNLRLLTPKESWLLFQLEVFGKPDCPAELEEHGRLIVDQCGRLPLAVVVISGVLVKRALRGDMNTRRKAWEKVRDRVRHYLNEDPESRMKKIISLSYNKLPYYLRPCFLYFGMFPEDFEIPAQKLILMWIAEGFIQQKNEISLEETAQDYLEELVGRNLIMGDKRSLNGSIKSCRIHDMLREFSKLEAGNDKEKLFQEMKMSGEGKFIPPSSEEQTYRRLSMHSHVLSFISSKPYGPRVRSFVSMEELTLPLKNISSIPAAFKLLRVLDVKSIKFTKFSNDLTHLVHLRYIALSSDFKILPESISKLWNLQTLIVDTTQRTLEINADLWDMINLRHFRTNASADLQKTPKRKEGVNKDLQTLGKISPKSYLQVFAKASGLKKLGIRGQIDTVVDTGFENLVNLEKLKLFNDVLCGATSEARVHCLPPYNKFPPALKSLTLSATYLKWEQMVTLSMLSCLEVLKLKDKAFMGRSWDASHVYFRHLEVLYIERSTDLVFWKASNENFPVLGSLILRNCEKLGAVPVGLHISLHNLYLKRCKLAVPSAKDIGDLKKQEQGQECTKPSGFRLIIDPGDE